MEGRYDKSLPSGAESEHGVATEHFEASHTMCMSDSNTVCVSILATRLPDFGCNMDLSQRI